MQMTFQQFLSRYAPDVTVEEAIGEGFYTEINGVTVTSADQIVEVCEEWRENNWVVGEPK